MGGLWGGEVGDKLCHKLSHATLVLPRLCRSQSRQWRSHKYSNCWSCRPNSPFFFSGSLTLRARDSTRNVNKGPLPNLTRGFMATNHLLVLTSSREETSQKRVFKTLASPNSGLFTCIPRRQSVLLLFPATSPTVSREVLDRPKVTSSPFDPRLGSYLLVHELNTLRAQSTLYGLKRCGS